MKNKLLLLTILLISDSGLILAQMLNSNEQETHMRMMQSNFHGNMGFAGPWATLLWVVLLIVVFALIAKWISSPERKLVTPDAALRRRMNKKQYFLAFLLLATTFAVHFTISSDKLTLHVIFRFIYLAPIAYVGLKTGKRGGILIALIASILYAPHFLFGTASAEFQAGNIVAVSLFYITGLFTGHYRDVSQSAYMAQLEEVVEKPFSTSSKNILFYVDDKPLSRYTSEWFVNYFGAEQDISITLLWISMEDVEDIMESQDEVKAHIENLQKTAKEKLTTVESTFVNAGYSGDKINTKVIKLKNKVRLANVIQEELYSGSYDFVLIPKYKLSRSQEFLFGDTAIQLIRESGYPVLTVACDSLD